MQRQADRKLQTGGTTQVIPICSMCCGSCLGLTRILRGRGARAGLLGGLARGKTRSTVRLRGRDDEVFVSEWACHRTTRGAACDVNQLTGCAIRALNEVFFLVRPLGCDGFARGV